VRRLLFFLLFPAGLSAGSFPVGIYDVADEDQLRLVQKSGFNWARAAGSVSAAYLETARALGVDVIAPLRPAPSDDAFTADRAPVLYLFDEPDVHGVPPAEMQRRDDALRAKIPGVRTTFALGSGAAVEKYRSAGNFLMVDWYPVPHLPLDSVADQLDAAKRAAGVKPVWMILQAFDWRKDRQPNPARPRVGRFPTFDEIRFMTYLALVHRADGLFYYTLGGDTPMPLSERPGEWHAVRRAAGEVARLRPFLDGGETVSTLKTDAPLEARTWRRGRDVLAVLINRSDRPTPLPAMFLDEKWKPLFEARRRVGDNLAPGNQMVPWRALVLLGPAAAIPQ